MLAADGAVVTIVRFFVFSLASAPRRFPSDMPVVFAGAFDGLRPLEVELASVVLSSAFLRDCFSGAFDDSFCSAAPNPPPRPSATSPLATRRRSISLSSRCLMTSVCASSASRCRRSFEAVRSDVAADASESNGSVSPSRPPSERRGRFDAGAGASSDVNEGAVEDAVLGETEVATADGLGDACCGNLSSTPGDSDDSRLMKGWAGANAGAPVVTAQGGGPGAVAETADPRLYSQKFSSCARTHARRRIHLGAAAVGASPTSDLRFLDTTGLYSVGCCVVDADSLAGTSLSPLPSALPEL